MTLAFGEPSIVRYTNVCVCDAYIGVYVYAYRSRTDYASLYRDPRLHCAPSRKEGAPTLRASSHLIDSEFFGAYNG